MSTVVEHPDIRYVVKLKKADKAAAALPQFRHNADCGHFTAPDGTVLSKPVLATEEQMLELAVCRICIGKRIGGTTPTGRADGPIGEVCPTCYMARSLTGLCESCD